jgi:hypothetical protein
MLADLLQKLSRNYTRLSMKKTCEPSNSSVKTDVLRFCSDRESNFPAMLHILPSIIVVLILLNRDT